jgi:uncharacterized membrane protein YoaK (UPF0700 family)
VTRHPRREWWLAIALAALAGYVDAIGFLRLNGLFVSFMSGNSTRLAVALAGGSPLALTAASLILAFVAGVVVGATAGAALGRWRRPGVIVLAAVPLAVAAALPEFGPLGGLGTVLLALAMGGLNTVFQRDGEVSVGVTYMTGALVKLGQHLAGALMGEGARWDWLPYLLLWSGLIAGAFLGTADYAAPDNAALWRATGAALGIALLAAATTTAGGRVPRE